MSHRSLAPCAGMKVDGGFSTAVVFAPHPSSCQVIEVPEQNLF